MDPEVVQGKKYLSCVMAPGLRSYIQQLRKSSSLGWFTDRQELERPATAGLVISCSESVFVESSFQHGGKREVFVTQATPALQEQGRQGVQGEGRSSHTSSKWICLKTTFVSSSVQTAPQNPSSRSVRKSSCPGSSAVLHTEHNASHPSESSSVLHSAFPCLSPTDEQQREGQTAGKLAECNRKATARQHRTYLPPAPFPIALLHPAALRAAPCLLLRGSRGPEGLRRKGLCWGDEGTVGAWGMQDIQP